MHRPLGGVSVLSDILASRLRTRRPASAASKTITLRRGLDLPISGVPEQRIETAAAVDRVALVAPDYPGMRPSLAVQVGDTVALGQVLWTDKRMPEVRFTSPASGIVREINRGERRSFVSLVIEIDGDQSVGFPIYDDREIDELREEEVRRILLMSGLWTSLRARPFGRIASPRSTPHALFVTAIDTHPLGARPEVVLAEREADFVNGLRVLARLGAERRFLCVRPGEAIPGMDVAGWTSVAFAGPHPAGLPGTHIHFLAPVSRKRTAWHIGYQDVAAIGRLFTTGRLDVERVIALGGPSVLRPRLLWTCMGAELNPLLEGELSDGEHRVVSGSVLGGRAAQGPTAYLGRYDLQVSVLPAASPRELFGWLRPGADKHSVQGVTLGAWAAHRRFDMTPSLGGGRRAVFPVGSYEKVMPLDLLPNFLLRALENGDLDQAEALGALELVEEDLALCSYVCPGKQDYGSMLRRVLTAIEREE